MASFRYIIRSIIDNPRCMALWTTLTLLVPNAVLDCTETSPAIWKMVNVILPAGVYLLALMCHKRTGWMVIALLPFMVLASFQLVLLYLYGESIIAVDMYLNVVTTNMSEATELLGNLAPAIVLVVILYLPALACAVYQIARHINIAAAPRKEIALWGAAFTLFGAGLTAVAMVSGEQGSLRRDVFPVNVIANLATAVDRTENIADYPATSASFTYRARSLRRPSEREIYVFVIGETSRAINWQLFGYDRPTNPRLSNEPNIVFFDHALSESNTTHKSVPMLMSCVSSEKFNSVNSSKSIITAMKEAGFYTRFYSNQAPNHSYTEYFGNEAHDTRYTDTSANPHPYDAELIGMVHEAVTDTLHPKQFIVLHTYGSHFRYKDRYPEEFAHFLPDNALEASPLTRTELVNSYDNAIRYTDHVLASVIDELRTADCQCAMLYCADHGEDIYDDARNRFLHASPTPTYFQLHVAMLAWLSDKFCQRHPEMQECLRENCHRCVSPQKSMFDTAIDLSGVDTPLADRTKSLAGASYTFDNPVYLTDLNVAVPLDECAIKEMDRQHLRVILGR